MLSCIVAAFGIFANHYGQSHLFNSPGADNVPIFKCLYLVSTVL